MAERGPCLLALDVGTGSVRASLFSPEGRPLARAARRCATAVAPGGVAELDLRRLWAAAADAVREATADAAHRIEAVGVSGALGLVVTDAAGEPLAPALLWQDRRAVAEARELVRALGEESLYATCGRRVDPELVACKLLWLRRQRAELWARRPRVLGLKDWLVQRLTGAFVTDPSCASYTLLYDVHRARWDPGLLDAVGLVPEQLPAVRPAQALAGRLAPVAATDLGLPEGLPVAVGGPDGSLGALGAGLVVPGRAVDVAGTTDVLLACLDRPVADASRRTVLNVFLTPERWAVGGPLGLTGGALRWLAELLGTSDGGEIDYARLDALAARIAPGSEGVLALPALSGERMPNWDPHATGVFFGLAPHHGPGHLARALLEGIAFAVAEALAAIEAAGVAVAEVRLAGGGARSRVGRQIRADALGRRLLLTEVDEATSLGTAIVAGTAVGLFADLEAGAGAVVRIAEVVEPEPEATARYRTLAGFHQELAQALRPLFARAVLLPAP